MANDTKTSISISEAMLEGFHRDNVKELTGNLDFWEGVVGGTVPVRDIATHRDHWLVPMSHEDDGDNEGGMW